MPPPFAEFAFLVVLSLAMLAGAVLTDCLHDGSEPTLEPTPREDAR